MNDSLELSPAHTTFAIRDNMPCLVVVISNLPDIQPALTASFPTVIRANDYLPATLEATANLLLGPESQPPHITLPAPVYSRKSISIAGSTPVDMTTAPQSARLWFVEEWEDVRDSLEVWGLWREIFKAPFDIDQSSFSSLLRRPGYAKHYVVRDQNSNELLGFCGTYLTYVDKEGEKLVASLAIVMVHPSHRGQGIGLSLHNHSMAMLRTTRGVVRLQLGSMFPRILYGPPADLQNEDWFTKRGWGLSRYDVPGKGHTVQDLILDIVDWQGVNVAALTTQSCRLFRTAKQEDMHNVLKLVERTGKICWFDQYACLSNGPNVKDIILATECDRLVAVALTYTPLCGSQVSANLPWASHIGDDVGGITCICISGRLTSSFHATGFDSSIHRRKEITTAGFILVFSIGTTL
jgi:GNAT superfamily N-acetyltransferase